MSDSSATSSHLSPVRKILPTQPSDKRFAFWQRAFSGLGEISLPKGSDPAEFNFYGHSWQLPLAFLQVNGATAMALLRPQHIIDARPVEQMQLHMFLAGGATCSYDGQLRSHGPGDIVVVDYSIPYEIHTPGYEGIGITFDKASAPPLLRASAHGQGLSAGSSAGMILSGQLTSLVEHIEGLSIEQAQAAIDGILRFAETAVPSNAAGAMRDSASVFDRASWLARQHLSNPDFGPDELLSALNISRSKLFRAFAPHGGVQRWLLAARLRASLHNIVGWPGNLKMSEIASKHGFRSEAHFSRAFHKRYHTSPSAVRALISESQDAQSYLVWTAENDGTETTTIEAWLASVRKPVSASAMLE